MLDRLRKAGGRVSVNPGFLALLGTLGCLLLSLALAIPVLGGVGGDTFRRGLAFAILLPLLIAPVLFFVLGRLARELSLLRHEHTEAIARDSLTACFNSTLFSALVDAHPTLAGSRAGRRQGAFLVMDVDHLALLNSSLGHRAGDQALRDVAEIIRGSVRKSDLVGRLGGGAFGVFLPGATRENAEGVAERIRRAVFQAGQEIGGKERTLSISVGAVVFEHEVPYDELVRSAEQILQVAKERGRNRVEVVHLDPASRPSSGPSLH